MEKWDMYCSRCLDWTMMVKISCVSCCLFDFFPILEGKGILGAYKDYQSVVIMQLLHIYF